MSPKDFVEGYIVVNTVTTQLYPSALMEITAIVENRLGKKMKDMKGFSFLVLILKNCLPRLYTQIVNQKRSFTNMKPVQDTKVSRYFCLHCDSFHFC